MRMSNPRLIGIGGHAFSGKDAVADVLEAEGWHRTFLSKPLNEAMKTLNPKIPVFLHGLPPYDVEYAFDRYLPGNWDLVDYSWLVDKFGYNEAKKNPEVRRLLQVFATEVVREMFGQDTWVNLARKEIQEYLDKGQSVVITGVRFDNEVQMITALGGELWWVHRPGYGPVNSHISDNWLKYSDFDRVVMNDGSLDDLSNMVTKLLGER